MSDTPAITAQKADFTFQVGEMSTEDLRVTAFEGTEGISELYFFRVELASDTSGFDDGKILGKECKLALHGESGTRFVHGMVRSFEKLGDGVKLSFYAAEIVPLHWQLTRRVHSRIYQADNCPDMTVPGIVARVFEIAGIPPDRFEFLLNPKDCQPREFVVQYRESEMDFISRIMEEEGIFYFFRHDENGHVMVIADSPAHHPDNPIEDGFPYRRPSGLISEGEFFFAKRTRTEMSIGETKLIEFDFARSMHWTEAHVTGGPFPGLHYHDYPAWFEKRNPGSVTDIRLKEQQEGLAGLTFLRATVRVLVPGHRFKITESDEKASGGSVTMSTQHLCVQLTHRATQPQSLREEAATDEGSRYECAVRAIGTMRPYRPPRKTPRPVVHGSQTAIVVGPEGEEIYVDEYGRVKVRFHWDPDHPNFPETSSCWIRVSQGMAGGQYGMMFIPRVGHEVVVDFLEGDPDRPIIVGRVYNSRNRPLPLPKRKTQSYIKTHSTKGGGGCNVLAFEDEKDSELVFLQAWRNLAIRSGSRTAETVDGERHLTVGKDQIELVKQNKYGEIKLDLHQCVGGNKSLVVKGGVAESFGSHSEATGSYYLKAKGDVVIEAGGTITLKSGGSFISITGGTVDIVAGTINLNSGGSAASGSAGALGRIPEPSQVILHEPGEDAVYRVSEASADPGVGQSALLAGGDDQSAGKQKTSWIEIELVDDANQPISGEPFEITTPEGEVIRGSLDAKGQARVALEQPGACKIRFTRLDQSAVERA